MSALPTQVPEPVRTGSDTLRRSRVALLNCHKPPETLTSSRHAEPPRDDKLESGFRQVALLSESGMSDLRCVLPAGDETHQTSLRFLQALSGSSFLPETSVITRHEPTTEPCGRARPAWRAARGKATRTYLNCVACCQG